MQKLVKQNEFEDNIQELYGANKPEELDSKSLYLAICTTLYRWRLADIIECLKYTSLAYTQHCLQNAEDNNNLKDNFLLDVDLSSASLHTAIYSGIMTDFNSEDTTL